MGNWGSYTLTCDSIGQIITVFSHRDWCACYIRSIFKKELFVGSRLIIVGKGVERTQ